MSLFGSIGKAIGSVVNAASGGGFGSILGAGLNFLGGMQANDTNQNIASMNNATAIELANSQYQRRVNDLKAAGLNPMIAYMPGSAGGSGGAAVPPLQQAKVENVAPAATQAALSAAQMGLLNAQTKTADSQAELNSATAAKTMSEKADIDNRAGLSGIQLESETLSKMKRIDVDYLELVARGSKAAAEKLRSSLDQNTQLELQEIATRRGFSTMEAALADLNFSKTALDVIHQKLRTNELQSQSDMWGSAYGKRIAPYVHSASQITNALPNLNFIKR